MSAEPNVRFNSVTSETPSDNHTLHNGHITFTDARGHRQTRPLDTITVDQQGKVTTYTVCNTRNFGVPLFSHMSKPAENPILVAVLRCVDHTGIPDVLGFAWMEYGTPGQGCFHIGSQRLGKLVAFTCLPETDFTLATAPAPAQTQAA